jgi:hypothetical protein
LLTAHASHITRLVDRLSGALSGGANAGARVYSDAAFDCSRGKVNDYGGVIVMKIDRG